MGVGIRRIGDVVVDHMGDAGHVDAPGRDVRRHQDLVRPVAEAVEGILALVLGEVPLERGRTVAGLFELLADAFGPVLRPREDEDRFRVGPLQELQEEACLQVLLDGIEGVGDGVDGRGMADPDRDGIGQHLLGQLPDVFGHGGGKHQGLALRGQLLDDPPDVREKAHVEHAVRLVDDEDLDGRQVDRLLGHMVEESAGAGDDDVDAPAELLDLRVDVHAAVDGAARDVRLLAHLADSDVDLLRQLPGGGDDQGANLAAGSRKETLQDRQHEGRRLARSRLGQAHDVFACQDRGDRLDLNRGRIRVAERRDAGGNLRVKLERTETHDIFFLCDIF